MGWGREDTRNRRPVGGRLGARGYALGGGVTNKEGVGMRGFVEEGTQQSLCHRTL